MDKSSSIGLTIALAIIMLGLGLSLTLDDFKRVSKYPKAIFIGLVFQMLILPMLCYAIVMVFNLPPELGVGLMLLAAAPGGATANLYSHLSHGDVALNITLTAINSILSVVTLPLIVNFALIQLIQDEASVTLQFKKVIEVFAIVLIPVALGMWIKFKNEAFAQKMDHPVRILSAILLLIIIIGSIVKEKEHILEYFQQIGFPALTFNVVSMLIGYFAPLALNIPKKQAIAIGMEIGIHNGTLAIYIALNILNNSTMAIPPAVYSIIMFITAGIFSYLIRSHTEDLKQESR